MARKDAAQLLPIKRDFLVMFSQTSDKGFGMIKVG